MNRDREIIALTKRCGTRLFFIGHRADGTSRIVYVQEAMRLAKGALDFVEGVRMEITKRKEN